MDTPDIFMLYINLQKYVQILKEMKMIAVALRFKYIVKEIDSKIAQQHTISILSYHNSTALLLIVNADVIQLHQAT